MKDSTTRVLAHRLSTVQRADGIVVMAAGRSVDTGPSWWLVARCARATRRATSGPEGCPRARAVVGSCNLRCGHN